MSRLLRLVAAHGFYQHPGGEDTTFAAETALLESHGHEVLRFTKHNDQAASMNHFALAETTIWNREIAQELRALIRRERPQLVHFHNTFPLISPAAYYAAKAEGVPVVQTLQNYRLLCPNALFFRDGHACEDCLGKFIPWPGVVHACYRDSRPASGVVAAMLTAHRTLRTWTKKVDVYLALTEFHRQKLIEGGLPAEKIAIKPNFVYPDPGVGEGRGEYALFVGRLSPEKGLDTMLAAWERLGERIPLKVAGDGPLAARVAEASDKRHGVDWLGMQTKEQVLALMKGARFLVFPSRWYEGLPVVIVEAYATGLPVIASNLGNMSTLIDHGRTGLHFRPEDPRDLVAQVEWTLAHPARLAQMRREARTEFESKYTAERTYQKLMESYELAMGGKACL